VEKIHGLKVKKQSESWSSDPGGHMATDWLVQEFRFREN
jgi:hypothetical protein